VIFVVVVSSARVGQILYLGSQRYRYGYLKVPSPSVLTRKVVGVEGPFICVESIKLPAYFYLGKSCGWDLLGSVWIDDGDGYVVFGDFEGLSFGDCSHDS
jgi:hypothetical protein